MGLIFNLQLIHFCRCLSFIFISSLNPKKLISFHTVAVRWRVSFSLSLSVFISVYLSIHPYLHQLNHLYHRKVGLSCDWGYHIENLRDESLRGEKSCVILFTNFHWESYCYPHSSYKVVSSLNVFLPLISKEDSGEAIN